MKNFFKFRLFFFAFSLILNIASQQLNTLFFCQKNQACLHLNDHNFQQNWKSLNQKLYQVQQIVIKTIYLNQKNMLTIFSHPMTKIKSIDFFNQTNQFQPQHQYLTIRPLTPRIIQTIFTSHYFQRLQALDLQNTNLDYRHFQFLQSWDQSKTISLKNLSLSQNYLEKKAFKYLQKLNFNGKLLSLDLSHNSLIQSQTINSVKKIIQAKNNSSSTVLRNLSLFGCSLKGSGLINILQSVETQILEHLNIGYNNLHHSKRYSIPFNNTVYEWISKQNFKSLQVLNMTELDLDESHISYFQKMKLPSLKILVLNSNFLNDDYFKKWILHQNMPFLKNLQLVSTSITDECIKLLIKQNFTLQKLEISKNKKLNKFIQYLAQLNTQNLKRISLSSDLTNEQRWEIFFKKVNLRNLEWLEMYHIQNLNNFFYYVNLEDMKNLKTLHIDKVDVFSGISQVYRKNIIFQKLQHIKIQDQSLSEQQLVDFINTILINFTPNLKLLSMKETKCINLSKINIQKLSNNFILQIECMTIRKKPNTAIFQAIKINFGQNFIQSNQNKAEYQQLCKKQNISQYQCNSNSFQKHSNLVKNFDKTIKKVLDFNNIEQIMISSNQGRTLFKQIFFGHISQQKLIKQFSNVTNQINDTQKQILPQIQTEVYLPFLKLFKSTGNSQGQTKNPILPFFLLKILSPELNYLVFQGQRFDNYSILLNQIISKSQNLQAALFQRCEINCRTFTIVFQNIQLPYLYATYLSKNKVESSCLDTFFHEHQFLRLLNLNGNFLQKNIFDVLSSNDIILKILNCNMIRMGNEQFSKLALLNTQFLKHLQMSSIGINSSGIQLFLQRKQKQQFNKIVFPKIMIIQLDMNQLQSQPLKQLFDTEMHNLNAFFEIGSGNQNFINDILHYPNKINNLVAYHDYVNSINKNLDPRSTRNLKRIVIEAINLDEIDFQNLARLNFQELNQVLLILSQVSDCQLLKQLLKICKYTETVQIYIQNQKQNLNDSCISDEDMDKLKSDHLKNIVVFSSKKQVFIPKFINATSPFNKYIQKLITPYNFLEDKILKQIIYNNKFNKTTEIYLHNNRFTDESISVLLSQNISNIQALSISFNQITQKSLLELANHHKKLQKLKLFYLQSIFIGDQGIQILTKIQFPSLQRLYLSNIDMTFIGLKNLLKINAPKLQYLRITNNNITQFQFTQFILSQAYLSFNHLKTIDTNIKISQKNMKIIKSSLQKHNKTLLLVKSEVYHLQPLNAARFL